MIIGSQENNDQGGGGVVAKFLSTCALKVCHSSAFQTISVRSFFIKIINYSGSIFCKLNNTMQTKTACNEKTTLVFKWRQDLQGT